MSLQRARAKPTLIGRRFHATLDFELGRISEGTETFPGVKQVLLSWLGCSHVTVMVVVISPFFNFDFPKNNARCCGVKNKMWVSLWETFPYLHTQQRFWQKLFWVWFFKLLSTNHGFCCALFVFWKSGNYLFHLKHFLSRVWREGLPSDGIFPSFPPCLLS